jgi:hypothetical protein
MTTTKWFLPSVSIALGVAFMAAHTIGGDLRTGVSALGLMAVVALGVLVGGRSEMVRGLRGDGRDEYWEGVDRRATLAAGLATLTAIIGMCLWEWGHGRDGAPYVQLGTLGGAAYLVALLVIRLRG